MTIFRAFHMENFRLKTTLVKVSTPAHNLKCKAVHQTKRMQGKKGSGFLQGGALYDLCLTT